MSKDLVESKVGEEQKKMSKELMSTAAPSFDADPIARKRHRTVMQYAEKYKDDLMAHSVIQNEHPVMMLWCRVCLTSVSPRSDRIQEHLRSKKHLKGKQMQRDAEMVTTTDAQEESGPGVSPLNGLKRQLEETFAGLPLKHKPVKRSYLEDGQMQTENHVDLLNSSTSTLPCTSSPESSGESPEGTSTHTQRRNTTQNMAPSQKKSENPFLLITWKGYNSNLIAMFSKYRDVGQFTDMNIMCEGKIFKCHRAIVCASVRYFEDVMSQTCDDHHFPTIVMKDFRAWEIEAMLDFVYHGQINKLRQSQLQDFLRVGKSLGIKGLFKTDDGNND